MSATTIVFVAFILYVAGAWAHNRKPANMKSVAAAAFVLLIIALLDQGETADIARGFAWLFLIVIFLSKDSPVSGLANVINKKG